jgi:hypothetical protein
MIAECNGVRYCLPDNLVLDSGKKVCFDKGQALSLKISDEEMVAIVEGKMEGVAQPVVVKLFMRFVCHHP